MSDCIEWGGYVGNHGYGKLTRGGESLLAHRDAYKKANNISDADMKGLCVCHTCDNRKCVNAEHMFLGTKGDNAADRNAKGRTCKGEGSPQSKLTEQDVLEIRQLWKTSTLTQVQIGRQYKVSNKTISKIVRRKRWTHI